MKWKIPFMIIVTLFCFRTEKCTAESQAIPLYENLRQQYHQLTSDERQKRINDMRGELFRDLPAIYDFYKHRLKVFSQYLNERETEYYRLRHSVVSKDVLRREALFEEIDRLESKVSHIRQMANKFYEMLLREYANESFDDLLKEYKKNAKYDLIQSLHTKRKILLLVLESIERLRFPVDSLEKVKGKISDIESLIKVQSYWDQSLNDKNADWVELEDPAYFQKLPSHHKDHTGTKGRKNYMSTVIMKEKDLRLDNRVDTQRIEEKVFNATVDDEKSIKTKAFMRSIEKEIQD